MARKKYFQELFVGNSGGIEIYLNRLGVPPKAPVGRILLTATGITDPGSDNTVKAPEPGVRTPESAQGKGCGRDRFVNPGVDGG